MANVKRRLQVPIGDDLDEALEEYCEISKSTKASVCGALLSGCSPVIREMSNALRVARTAPEKALRGYADYIKSTVEEANKVEIDLEKAAKKGGSGS